VVSPQKLGIVPRRWPTTAPTSATDGKWRVEDDVVDLRDQLAVLRRRWPTIVLSTLLVTAAAVGLALSQTPRYTATSQLLVSSVSSGERQEPVLEPGEISTQVEVLTSQPVATRVIRGLDLDERAPELMDDVTVEQLGDTRVLNVSVERSSARRAQQIANAFATGYLAYRNMTAQREAAASTQAVTQQIEQLRAQLDGIEDALADAEGAEQARLQADREALLVQITQAQSQLLETPTDFTGATAGQVLVPATRPTSPSEPDILRTVLLGLAIGLLVGVGGAFVRDHLDDAVRDEARLRQALHRPVLGRIPQTRAAQRPGLATFRDPDGPISEAFRALASSVRFLIAASTDSANRPAPVLLVTSPHPGEGKSTVAANLAVAAARFGLRVVLVDADLRKPTLAESLGLGTPPGLSDTLAGHHTLDDVLIPELHEGLTVLTAGSVAPNPAELLASTATRALLGDIRARSDLVVLDSPPLLGVADALQLVPHTDLVLLVSRHASTRTRSLQRVAELIRQVGGEISGVVYNSVPSGRTDVMSGYGQVRKDAAAKTRESKTA
jgi:polysaccharide biosynthesis transport protein